MKKLSDFKKVTQFLMKEVIDLKQEIEKKKNQNKQVFIPTITISIILFFIKLKFSFYNEK